MLSTVVWLPLSSNVWIQTWYVLQFECQRLLISVDKILDFNYSEEPQQDDFGELVVDDTSTTMILPGGDHDVLSLWLD